MFLVTIKMSWGIFKKIINLPLQGIKKYINYKDKGTTVKADLLNQVSDFIPQLRTIAPVIKIADGIRKKATDPVVKWINKLEI